MKRILILISVFFIINIFYVYAQEEKITNNFTDNKGLKQGKWEKKYPNGKIWYAGIFKDDHPIGEFKRYHTNGALKALMNFDLSGIKAYTKLYYNTGQIAAEGIFNQQKNDSTWIYYSAKKIPVFIINYKKGIKHGIAKRFSPEGYLLEETEWKNGQIDGLWKQFYSSGKEKLVINYKNNKRNGLIFRFYSSGGREITGSYNNDLRDGTWSFYEETGSLKFVIEYDNGKAINQEELDEKEKEEFRKYEKNRYLLKDPQNYINNPMDYINKKN